MLVWSVASQKGGVGKTTTVASLAGWLQKEGLRVLAVDTDPHASLTAYLGYGDDSVDRNLYDLYKCQDLTLDEVRSAITYTRFKGLDLIASSMALATTDRQLSGRAGVGRILSRILSFLEEDYDVILIDCPPVLGALMVNALAASSLVIVPTQTDFLAMKGLEGMIKTFGIMQKASGGRELDHLVVPTMSDDRDPECEESLARLRKRYQNKVWDKVIPPDDAFAISSSRQMPLPLMNRRSRGSEAYRKLLDCCIAHALENCPDKVSQKLRDLSQKSSQSSTSPSASELLTDDLNSMLGPEEF